MADSTSAWRRLHALCKSIRSLGRVLFLGLVLTSAASAQPRDSRSDIDTPGLVIEATLGWDGIVDHQVPVPVSFLIHNNSEREIAGILSLSDILNGNEATLGDVVISPGASRRFTAIQSMNDWYDCIARLNHNGKILWRRELVARSARRFDPNLNHVMFVDNGGWKLSFPNDVTDNPTNTMQEFDAVGGKQGRQLQSLKVKPWQLPNHPGPLCVVSAMVFPEGAVERDLNKVQWEAVAKWMCQGGAIFVHDMSREIIDRIVELSPLRAETALQSGLLMVRRTGLGALYVYSGTLAGPNGEESRQSIADVAANLYRNQINTFSDAGYIQMTHEQRANKNRTLVAVFFLIYTILTGGVTFFLFRCSQKQIAGYAIVVVATASICSGVLGGYLRYSPGDLNWTTVTQAGIGGLVQVAAIEVQSAGSRNTRVAVNGEHTDLQWISRNEFNYYGAQFEFGYSPFVWQRNQSTSEGIYQINVPMMLWGRRRCHAMAFKPDTQPLD